MNYPKEVEWVIDCEPRPVQMEAIARSYTGFAYRNHKDAPVPSEPIFALGNAGQPAKGFSFFMQMRLGKSSTILNEVALFVKNHGFKNALIFSPSKFKYGWAIEAEERGMDLFDLPVHVFESGEKGRKEARKFVDKGRGILIVNYEALGYDTNAAIIEDWVTYTTYVAADESVLIKNKESQFYKNSKQLGDSGGVVRNATGKPIVQGPHDLYSQLRFTRKLNGWKFYEFRGKYCEMGGFKRKSVLGTRNEKELNERLQKVGFIAERKDWGTWFESDYVHRQVSMGKEQLEQYKSMEHEFVVWLEDGTEVTAEQVITKRMKMQQISSGFIFDEDRKANEIVPFNKVPKFQALADDLTNEIDNKAVIIAVYNPTIDNLLENLKHLNPAVIRGSQKDVEEQKAKFNDDPSCKILIGQEKAVKYGHKLMGSKNHPCEYMLYFENSYSLDDRAQSVERPQGEGQQKALTVIDYYSGGVERDIINALQRKESISQAIMNYYDGEQ